MNKFIVFAVSLFMAFASHASFPPPTVWSVSQCGQPTITGPSLSNIAAQCAARVQQTIHDGGNTGCTISPVVGVDQDRFQTSSSGTCSGGGTYFVHTPQNQCPANSTLANGQCTCSAGYSESGSTCVEITNPCTSQIGVTRTTNFTLCYTRTADEDDLNCVGSPNQVPADGTLCDGGCTVERGPGTNAWASLTPTAQGLHRLSIDFSTVPTGAQCTVGTTGAAGATNPATPPPDCPGFVGEVNGKTGCFGTASKPVTTGTGSTGGLAKTPGNPAAGTKPTTGEGSGSTGAGRTPSAGSGGNSGGPASAAQGPTGLRPAPQPGEEQAACGAPGQPKCAIDETGTPTGAGVFDSAKTGLNGVADARKNAIDGAASISAPAWSFTFQLPTGCTPLQTQIRGFVMNPCAYQATIHDLMSMLWAGVTLWTIISMVGRTIRES